MCDDVRAGVLCFGMCFGICSHSSSCWLRRFMLSLRSRAALPWVLSRVTPDTSQRNTSHVTRHASHVTRHTSLVTRHTSPAHASPAPAPAPSPNNQTTSRWRRRGRAACLKRSASHVTRNRGKCHESHGTEEHVMRHTSHVARHLLRPPSTAAPPVGRRRRLGG